MPLTMAVSARRAAAGSFSSRKRYRRSRSACASAVKRTVWRDTDASAARFGCCLFQVSRESIQNIVGAHIATGMPGFRRALEPPLQECLLVSPAGNTALEGFEHETRQGFTVLKNGLCFPAQFGRYPQWRDGGAFHAHFHCIASAIQSGPAGAPCPVENLQVSRVNWCHERREGCRSIRLLRAPLPGQLRFPLRVCC